MSFDKHTLNSCQDTEHYQHPRNFPCAHSQSACVCHQLLSHVWLCGMPWTVTHQVALPIGFSRQEYWSGLPFLPPGDLPDSGTGPVAPASAAEFFTTKPLGKLSCATHQIFLMLYFLGTWKNCTSLPLLKLGMVTWLASANEIWAEGYVSLCHSICVTLKLWELR